MSEDLTATAADFILDLSDDLPDPVSDELDTELRHLEQQAEDERLARQAAEDADDEPELVDLPEDFDAWTIDMRETWAYDPEQPRAVQTDRRRLYATWLAEHPEGDPLRKPAAAPPPCSTQPPEPAWTNAVTADSWDDAARPTAPTICKITGTSGGLFASGRVSRLFGSSGSAKTWIVKRAALETLAAGGSVLFLDGDGIWQDFRDHLKLMGLSRDDALSGRLHYSRVEGSLLSDDFRAVLASQAWSLIVLDGFNATMAAAGLKGSDDPDVNLFFSAVLNPAAATGAAVVLVDHMKKDGLTDHGSVFKRNNLTGTDYAVNRQSLIAPGLRGYSSITLTPKDRPGWATSLQAQRGRLQDQPFAFVIVDSTGDNGVPTVISIELDAPPDVLLNTAWSQANADADTLRALLRDHPAGFASNARVRAALKARSKDMDNNRINAAALLLVTSGEATRTKTGQSLDLKPAPAQPAQTGGRP